ncbi:hypothetical protein N7474_005970 [Penicillium riverlandense]|uniref:uncharacterized protein n=1 Tax=Penicillium riverlandense TaxID=1903569 RepID=UPI0025496AEC|nr:uncharacterized protein N7474_005970 [Penicillium riverlandense]KAJ5820379.1 hypothetical protein N7474_005970 [Penicillium riverlandense]
MVLLLVPEMIASLNTRLGWALILVGVVVARVLFRRYATSIRDIPGPFWGSFSSLWVVYQLWKGHLEAEAIKLHKKHGYFVRIRDNEVSVSHPDAVRQLLHANLAKGPWYAIFSFPDYHYVNQMSELDPQRHLEKNRNVASGYTLSNIIQSEPYVDAVFELLIKHVDEHCDSGTPIEFNDWFTYFAFDVVGEVTFSKSFGFVKTGTDVRNAIANTRALALYVSVMGHYTWFHNLTLGSPLLSRLGIQPSSHIFDTCLAAINMRKENPKVRKDMMQQWLDTRAKYPDRMAENEIFAAAVLNVGAGSDTVSATTQSLFYWLLRYPQHLRRLREELDTAQARGELSPVVQYNEAKKLPFLQACMKENYRFHSIVPSPLPRVVPKGGITIGGRYFPEGVILSVNPWVYHRNPTLFGEDCDTFNPDRWLQGDTQRMDSFLIHWGAGYRQCVGRNLAHFEISKLAATLIRDFEFEQVDPKKEWEWKNHFSILPWGWPCKIRRRSIAG